VLQAPKKISVEKPWTTLPFKLH